ncbi:MAG TPA: hypothetical protein VKW78_10115 [Terriglobales bacterium]|nr:hypothetical protein [Terriglobales bacterium]
MRVSCLFVVVFLSMGAWTQQAKLVSAPTPHLQSDSPDAYTRTFQLYATPTLTEGRLWYWEVNDCRLAPSAADKYLPAKARVNNDFSPATLEWTFTGKRKLMPVVDLTVIKIKPGEGEKHTAGASVPDHSGLWEKATHSMMDFLHN